MMAYLLDHFQLFLLEIVSRVGYVLKVYEFIAQEVGYVSKLDGRNALY